MDTTNENNTGNSSTNASVEGLDISQNNQSDVISDRTEEKKCTLCGEVKTNKKFKDRKDYRNNKLIIGRRKDCSDCYNKTVRNLRATYKKQVFDYYGKKCVCCGESNYAFLTMDHINNDGFKDKMKYGRKRKLVGKELYFMIIKEGFPNRFQTLCQNCNFGKKVCGVCPHQNNGKCGNRK